MRIMLLFVYFSCLYKSKGRKENLIEKKILARDLEILLAVSS